jgi:hypothetical protein
MPSDDAPSAPAAYDLTAFTGRKKNAERVFFVRNYEMNLFTSYVVGGSIIVSLPVTLMVFSLISVFSPSIAIAAFGVPVLFVFGGLYFIDQRSKRGLQLRNYRALIDKRSSATEKATLYICGEPVVKPAVNFFTPQYVLAGAGAPLSTPAVGRSVTSATDTGKASILDA